MTVRFLPDTSCRPFVKSMMFSVNSSCNRHRLKNTLKKLEKPEKPDKLGKLKKTKKIPKKKPTNQAGTLLEARGKVYAAMPVSVLETLDVGKKNSWHRLEGCWVSGLEAEGPGNGEN